MAVFVAKVRDSKGQSVTKEIEATNITEVRGKLKEQGLFPMEISQKAQNASLIDTIKKRMEENKKVKLKDLTIFSRQFSTMINAGVSLVRTLNILADQATNPRFK